MILSDYIDQVGAVTIAEATGTTKSNVYAWKRLEGVPKIDRAIILIAFSHNVLSFESIYVPYLRMKAKKDPELNAALKKAKFKKL